ncbi:cupin domain-containing protein [Dyella sp. M7H15-1]|uniref:cupin domain-containing protein n=1 Tax=Dyella sp. M7H15-1 TaxID=2501295 RepID=UPI0013E8BB12|nr:cupin domain-containing protein [Dyella sp. M7H15-1]
MSITNVFDALGSKAEADKAAGINIAKLADSHQLGHYATELPPGAKINPHYHRHGEELYLILQGSGLIHMWKPGEQTRTSHRVRRGSVFNIPAGTVHQLENDSTGSLVLVFSCHPDHLGSDRVLA